MRRLALLAACLLFAAGPLPATAAEPAPADHLQLIDLTPEFAKAWAATQALPDAQRVDAFDAAMAPLLPGFYDPARFKGPGADRYRARLLKTLKAFPEDRATVEDVSRRFAEMFRPAVASFEARFGPMSGYPPVYLIDSLGEFDGATRDLRDGTRLLFGADQIGRIHAGHDIQPFFHHELFHILHARSFAGCPQVWCHLWLEGLAVDVAAQLKPGATDQDLLLDLPEPIRPLVDKHRAEAVCAVTQRLDSEDEKDMGALFSSSRMSPDLPPRFGYYVGYLAAQELGKTRSLDQLAKLGPGEVRPLLVAALHNLADCPPGTDQ